MPDRIDPQAQWYNTEIENKVSQPTLGQSDSMQVRTGQVITRRFGAGSLTFLPRNGGTVDGYFIDAPSARIFADTACTGCPWTANFGVDISYLPVGSQLLSYRIAYIHEGTGILRVFIGQINDASLGSIGGAYAHSFTAFTHGLWVIGGDSLLGAPGPWFIRSDAMLTVQISLNEPTTFLGIGVQWIELTATVPGLTY